MKHAALILAFISAGIGIVLTKISDELNLAFPAFLNLILCIPAVLLGTRSWLTRPSYARSWPVVACVLAAWIGLLYAADIDSKRGYLIATVLAIPLPVAALIDELRAWRLCARVFVLTNVVALAFILWFEYKSCHGSLFGAMTRIGFLYSIRRGAPLSNPCAVGGQLVIASILATILYFQGLPRFGRPASAYASRHNGLYLASSIVLLIGCLLTASRAAFVTWFFGAGYLFLFGTKGLPTTRIRNIIALSAMLFGLGLFTSLLAGVTPWSGLQDRFVGERAGSLKTIGGRQQIWQSGLQIWLSDSFFTFCFGVGTGVADNRLGELEIEHASLDKYGNPMRNPHSVFLEWLVNFGLLGVIPGVCMLVAMFYRARELDTHDGSVARVAILLTVCLFSTTDVLYRDPCWIGVGALILSMFASPPRPTRRQPSLQAHRANDLPRPHTPPTTPSRLPLHAPRQPALVIQEPSAEASLCCQDVAATDSSGTSVP
jgi:O-antigen ligase